MLLIREEQAVLPSIAKEASQARNSSPLWQIDATLSENTPRLIFCDRLADRECRAEGFPDVEIGSLSR